MKARKTPRYTAEALRRNIVLMTEAKRQAERCLDERDLAGHCAWAQRAQEHYRAADRRAQDLGVKSNDWRQSLIHNMTVDVSGGWFYRERVKPAMAGVAT